MNNKEIKKGINSYIRELLKSLKKDLKKNEIDYSKNQKSLLAKMRKFENKLNCKHKQVSEKINENSFPYGDTQYFYTCEDCGMTFTTYKKLS